MHHNIQFCSLIWAFLAFRLAPALSRWQHCRKAQTQKILSLNLVQFTFQNSSTYVNVTLNFNEVRSCSSLSGRLKVPNMKTCKPFHCYKKVEVTFYPVIPETRKASPVCSSGKKKSADEDKYGALVE